jgi:hypothetical protein
MQMLFTPYVRLFYLLAFLVISIRSKEWWDDFELKYNTPNPQGLIITGFTANHFLEASQMVYTAQTNLPPYWSIVVYDLIGDLSAEQVAIVKSWCNVTYTRFIPPVGFTGIDSPAKLTNSAWKALIINENFHRLPAGSILVYTDASNLFKLNLNDLIYRTRKIGFAGRLSSSPTSMYTHPNTILELSNILAPYIVNPNITAYEYAPVVHGAISFWLVDPLIDQLILQPFLNCSLNELCILPKGASGFGPKKGCHPSHRGSCHRGDQSVISVIMYGYYGKAFLYGTNMIQLSQKEHFEYPYLLKNFSLYVGLYRHGKLEYTANTCQR